MNGRLLVVGDALLDREVEGRAEPMVRTRPGGAGLAAVLAVRNGRPVTLLTALSRDEGGSRLARLLLAVGVDLIDLGLEGETPERIRRRRSGKPHLQLDRGGSTGGIDGPTAAKVLAAVLSEADGVLICDHGRGIASDAHIQAALTQRADGLPLVWEPHPQGALPLAGTTLATPNLAESVACTGGRQPDGEEELAELATTLSRQWEVERVAITLGGKGALLSPEDGRPPVHVRCAATAGETCGAGDAFAAEAAARLTDGQGCRDAVTSAVAAAARFAAGGDAGESRISLLTRPSERPKRRLLRRGWRNSATSGNPAP